MAQFRYIHIGNPSPGAKLLAFLILALATALLIALGILALSLFVIVAPIVLVSGAAYYLYRRFFPRAATAGPAQDGIIEGEYRIIDPDAPRIQPPMDRDT